MKSFKSIRTFVRLAAIGIACAAMPALVMGWQPSMSDAYVARAERVTIDGPADSKDAQIDRLNVSGKAALGQLSVTVTQSSSRGKASKVDPGWEAETVTVPGAMGNWEGGLYGFVAKPVHKESSNGSSTRGFTVGAPMGFLLMVCALVLMSEARQFIRPEKKPKEK